MLLDDAKLLKLGSIISECITKLHCHHSAPPLWVQLTPAGQRGKTSICVRFQLRFWVQGSERSTPIDVCHTLERLERREAAALWRAALISMRQGGRMRGNEKRKEK